MGWTLNHNQKENITIPTYEGNTNFRAIVKASIACINQLNKHNAIKVLIDCTDILLEAKREEIFELPNNLYTKWGLNPDTKIALTEPKDMNGKTRVEFYVYATRNLGWNVKVFPLEKKAKQWLLED